MSATKNLQGGLGNSTDNGSVLEEARKKLVVRKEIDLQRLLKKPAVKIEGRMAGAELAKYVDELADGAFEFVFGVARPFIRKLDKDVLEIGEEVKFDVCEDSNDTRQQRADEYESTIPILTDYVPENDRILREEAEVAGRRQFVEVLCLRVQVRAKIGLLADDIRGAEDKDYLEHLLEKSKDGTGRVFVKSSAKVTPIRAFGKGYDLAQGVFGERHHEFASKKLAEVVNARARELATAFKSEMEKRKQEVSVEDDELVSPGEFLFGDSDGTAVLPWKFQGHENAVKLRRSGDRLYIIDAVGSPFSALEAMREEHKEPFVLLRHILAKDGEHLCLGKMVDGRPRYQFSDVVARAAFQMTLWVRTAAGVNCQNRLLPDDDTRQMFSAEVANGKKPNGNDHSNGFKPAVPLVDTDGKEVVEPETFWFRKVNGGAGTVVVLLPKGFVLHLPEGYNKEQRDPIAPERDVTLEKETAVHIRRSVVKGEANLSIDDCDNPVVHEDLRISGFIGNPAPEGNWFKMGLPWAKLMPFGYKQACESGQIEPRKKD